MLALGYVGRDQDQAEQALRNGGQQSCQRCTGRMSALPQKADICSAIDDVRSWAEIADVVFLFDYLIGSGEQEVPTQKADVIVAAVTFQTELREE